MSDRIAAARSPPLSDPANNQFFLLCISIHNRKSWLFAGSDRGADRAAFMATLSSTTSIRRPGSPTSSPASPTRRSLRWSNCSRGIGSRRSSCEIKLPNLRPWPDGYVSAAAIAAGWRPDEVASTLVEVADHDMFALIENRDLAADLPILRFRPR